MKTIEHHLETIDLARHLAVVVAPRIVATSWKLSQYADFEGRPWHAVRCAAAYWLWTGSEDLFANWDVPVRQSLSCYFKTGDTAYFWPTA